MNGHTLLSWQGVSYPKYEKKASWYIIAGSIVVTFVVYGILSNAVTMSSAFILLAGVYLLAHQEEEKKIDYLITTLGVQVGNHLYPYSELQSFHVLYNSVYKNTLILSLKEKLVSELMISLDEVDVTSVREILLSRKLEEKSNVKESAINTISRVLKI